MDDLRTEGQQGPSIQEMIETYIDILRRRKFYFVFTSPFIFIAAVAVVLSLPPLYQSTGRILIKDADIPEEFIRSTVTDYAEKQIESTKQGLMTSAKILEMVEKYNLYPRDRSDVAVTEITERFRTATIVKMISASVPGQRRKVNIAFEVSFFNEEPQKAQLVANELATLFLEENVKSRTEKADETAKFLEEEADRMQARVQEVENEIAEFKVEHGDSLPELLEFNLQTVERIEQQILASQEESIQLNEQLHSLNIQLTNTSPYLQFSSSGGQQVSPRQRLTELRTRYTELTYQYSDSHPDVVQVKQEMEIAEQALKTAASGSVDDADNPIYRQLLRQITSVEGEIKRVGEQRTGLESDLAEYNSRVKKTHQVKRGFDSLTRDYENKLDKYRELRAKQLEANVAQNLEAENKAGSFSLIEPPVFPGYPVKPNKTKLLAMALIVSVGFGVGLMLLVEFLDPGIRGIDANRKVFAREPLAQIPHLYTVADASTIKRNRIVFSIVAVVSLVVGVTIFHFFILELDVFWLKLVNKINLL